MHKRLVRERASEGNDGEHSNARRGLHPLPDEANRANEKTYLFSIGIGELEDRVDAKRFARAHRSHIIAFPAVDHLRSDDSGAYKVILYDGTTVRPSRSCAHEIRDHIL